MFNWLNRVFVVFVTVTVFFTCQTIEAKSSDEDQAAHQKALDTVRAKIDLVRKSLGAMQSQRDRLTERLRAVETEYGKIAKSISETKLKMDERRAEREKILAESERLRLSVEKEAKILAGQLRSAHIMGRDDRLKLMLNQEDPARINRLLVYYDYLNRERVSRFSKMQEMMDKLGILEKEHARASVRLQNLVREKQSEQARLEEVRLARKQILEALVAELKVRGDQLLQLKSNESHLTGLLASIQRIMAGFPMEETPSLPFRQLRGRLNWPVKGKLVKKFGTRRKNGRWDGVLIAASEGASVRAIARGRIAYSDWLRGYGLLAIVDHGDGFMTLYAFNQSLYKEVGEWVETDEVIASVGQSGGRQQPALYFGIRRSGEPINPVTWCQKIRGATVG